MRKKRKGILTVTMALCFISSLLLSCGGQEKSKEVTSKLDESAESTKVKTQAESTPRSEFVVLDGYEASTGITFERINLWKNHEDRSTGISATAKHGDKVKFIKREGDGVLVETKNGERGWVTYYFIKELKSD